MQTMKCKAAAVRNLPSGLLRPSRARARSLQRDGEQHVRQFVGVQSVRDARRHDQHVSGGEVVALVGGGDGQSAAEHLNEDGAIGAVLAEFAARLEDEQR
jgi:hypothetical protein